MPTTLLLVLLPCVTASQDASATAPAGRILFTRQKDRRDDLFVLHLPDGRVERLTDHRAKDSHGIPSPDGTRIVFNSERKGWWKVWAMNADGTGVEQLTSPRSGADYYPCWSPDGGRILYVSGSQGHGDLVSIAPDGSDPVNLTNHPARDNFPAWSPTGEHIAFASDRERRWSIHVMRADGSDVRCVTPAGDALEPAWFPDGKRLAFQWAVEGEKAPSLWTVALGGEASEPRRLTDGKTSDERPAVSPDGRWIVFESDRAGGSQLFLVASTGGEVRQLTSEGYCYGASWFPGTPR